MQALRFYWSATKVTFAVLWTTNVISGTAVSLRMKEYPRGITAPWQAYNVFVISTIKSAAYAVMWPAILSHMLTGRKPFSLCEQNFVDKTID